MCGDKPWSLVDRKIVSRLYLSIGVESRWILNCKNPQIMIDTLSTADFWKIVESAFIRPRNIPFDGRVFVITKQLLRKTVGPFYGNLKELAENCDFENKEETLIRDVFITNLIDPEIQKELLKQTVEPRQAPELAINMELGMQNQQQIQQHNKTLISASVNAVQFPSNPDHQIGLTQTISRNRTVDHYIAQIAVGICYLTIVINVSRKEKSAMTAD